MNLHQLLQCVESRSVIRYSVDLATTSVDGLVCPPTYAPAKRGDPPYIAFRSAWVNGTQRDVVVLDSPQSQSNRVEAAILQACRSADESRRIAYPDIRIVFPTESGEPEYSVLQLSHRVYDAVMRACNWQGKPFYESELGRSILDARPAQATALYVHAPITLVLGAWDSNGGGGPGSAKFPRLLTSEIIGLDARPADVSAIKFDPMDIRSQVAELLPTDDPVRRFSIKGSPSKASAGSAKSKKPSEFGFGSVPSTAVPRAAVISGGIQTSVLSCSGLRQLSFPADNGTTTPERDRAGRAVLAALALYGLVAQNEAGYLLRSRCELVPRDDGRLDLIGRTLQDVDTVSLAVDTARSLLVQACEHAATLGLAWRTAPLTLDADDRLQDLVKRSRDAAAKGEPGQDA